MTKNQDHWRSVYLYSFIQSSSITTSSWLYTEHVVDEAPVHKYTHTVYSHLRQFSLIISPTDVFWGGEKNQWNLEEIMNMEKHSDTCVDLKKSKKHFATFKHV